MPSSAINGKSVIKQFINGKKDIRLIVDVGCGSGTYAKLLGKDYQYIGIEIFEKYLEKFKLKDLYQIIHIEDVYNMTVFSKMPYGDCIIFGDILEHLEKDRAMFVLSNALSKYPHVVVSIPVDGREGKIHYGNKYEKHLSSWTYDELANFVKWEKMSESKKIGVFCK